MSPVQKLSAGDQVKAALWIPLLEWERPLKPTGWDHTSEWLQGGHGSDWLLVAAKEEEAEREISLIRSQILKTTK